MTMALLAKYKSIGMTPTKTVCGVNARFKDASTDLYVRIADIVVTTNATT